MKKTAMATLFSCSMLVLTVVFGNTHSASAHEGSMYTTTAQQASEMGTMEAMRDFLLHMKEHREQIRNDDEHSEFRNAMRTDNGVWKYGTTYIITVNTGRVGRTLQAGEAIGFHAEHPAATDKSLRHIPIFQELMVKVEERGGGGEAVCVEDPTGKYGNHICAVETTITNEHGTSTTAISVAGFHHESNEVDDSKVMCPEFPSGYFGSSGTDANGEQFTRTSAGMVGDEESLKNYLKTVDEHITNEIKRLAQTVPGYAQLSDTRQREITTLRLARLRPCWRDENEPWKSGEIYFYLIRYARGEGAAKQYGIFNGLSPQFEDTTLLLYDGCIDVGQTVFQILENQNDGLLEYYWSNPLKDDDLVVDESGNPIRGLSPGTSVKLGYFLTTNFGGATKSDFVLGSGIYPEKEYYVPESGMCQDPPDYLSETARNNLDKFPVFPEQEKDDGGCAIASGDQGNLKIAGLNLFMIVVVMFFAVSRKNRLSGKLRLK